MNILIIAAEGTPFAKTGGLADVVGALPKFLQRQGHDARLLLPLHHSIKQQWGERLHHVADFTVQLGWRRQYAGVEQLDYNGLTCYFIDSDYYFGGEIYRGGEAEIEQYSFFSRAAMEALPYLDFTPQILHLNDWHTAVIALLLQTQYSPRRPGRKELPRTLLTIHNLAYQGRCSLGLACDLLNIDDAALTAPMAPLEYYGGGNFLKAGCVYADRINTVSPRYAAEILTPACGEGLDGVLRSRAESLCGILNGLDLELYDPAQDTALPLPFDRSTRAAGKAAAKAALRQELGLNSGDDRPLLAMVTRLAEQKGLDLLLPAADELLSRPVELVILGSGASDYEQALRALEQRHRGQCCAYIGYGDSLSRRIYAAADLYLMPSRFEPCGLSQLIAMRYGALPLVRETGGLCDTVRPYNKFTGGGWGFSFSRYTPQELLDTVDRALAVYGSGEWEKLCDQAMQQSFGFDHAAAEYAKLYSSMC